jgi:hypothetical protein
LFPIAFPQAISTLINEDQIKNEQIDDISICYHLVEDLNTNPHRIDHSSLLTFATALNLCYQRKLFQLHKHCQSIVIFKEKLLYINLILLKDTSNKSSRSINEILPIQIFESYTDNISNYLPVNKLF